jgi:hypothetical protein
MGPAGYHFGDYWKLELPHSLIVTGLEASNSALLAARSDRSE